jgi:hypothetical protein
MIATWVYNPSISRTHRNGDTHHGQQTQIDLARHVPVFAGAADGLYGDEVYQSSDGAGGASGRRDERDISYRAGRGVDESAALVEVESHAQARRASFRSFHRL